MIIILNQDQRLKQKVVSRSNAAFLLVLYVYVYMYMYIYTHIYI